MRHADRWDLPKGHVDRGETDLECALREFEEETGLSRADVDLDPGFRYRQVYHPRDKRGGKKVEKTLVIFLGAVDEPKEPVLTEHLGYEWVEWSPPHRIQERTIDPLLDAVARYLRSPGAPPAADG